MKMTFGRFILRSVLYIVVMNAVLFILCALFDGDFDPTLLGNVVVPVLCAYASFWGEEKEQTEKRKQPGDSSVTTQVL